MHLCWTQLIYQLSTEVVAMSIIPNSDTIEMARLSTWVAEHSRHPVPDFPVRCGVTTEATYSLTGDVEMFLPPVRTFTVEGEVCGWIRVGGTVVDVHAPASGQVTIHNPELAHYPELVIADPTGAGWLFAVMLDSGASGSAPRPHVIAAAGSSL